MCTAYNIVYDIVCLYYDIVCQHTISYVNIRYPMVPRIQMNRRPVSGVNRAVTVTSHRATVTRTQYY